MRPEEDQYPLAAEYPWFVVDDSELPGFITVKELAYHEDEERRLYHETIQALRARGIEMPDEAACALYDETPFYEVGFHLRIEVATGKIVDIQLDRGSVGMRDA